MSFYGKRRRAVWNSLQGRVKNWAGLCTGNQVTWCRNGVFWPWFRAQQRRAPTRPFQGRVTHAAGNQSGRIISNMFSGLISK